MRILHTQLLGFALVSGLVWSACKAPDPEQFPHVMGDGGSDSSSAGAQSAGAVAIGGAAPVAKGGATSVPSAGANAAGDSSGDGGGAVAAGGSTGLGGSGGTAACPVGSPVGPSCACAAPGDFDNCHALAAGIAHRYSFNGSGTAVVDSVGKGADGATINAALTGGGDVNLGSGDQYVDLPNNLISSLSSATLEAWVTWQSGEPWQRIFDFGDTAMGAEGERGFGRSYLFLSPKGTGNFVRAVFKSPSGNEVIVNSTPALATGVLSHLAVTFDWERSTMSLYVNGMLGGSVAVSEPLSYINDINDWLGRSQYAMDPGYVGSISEFRVYSVALTAAQVAFSEAQGPDTTLFAPAQ